MRMFFDFHIHGNPKLAADAKKLGYHGVTLVIPSRDSYHCDSRKNSRDSAKNGLKNSQNFAKDSSTNLHSKSNSSNDFQKQLELLKNLKNLNLELEEDLDIHIHTGVEIIPQNQNDLKKQIQKFRNKCDVILVHGGDLKINRAATEDPRVDILCHPYRNQYDAGINHILAVKALENRVAIELNLKYFLSNRPNQRYRVLNQFRSILKLKRKYNFPLIITSGARSYFDLRNPVDLMAMTKCFGMTSEEAYESISSVPLEIIRRNEIRDDVIVQGVRLVHS